MKRASASPSKRSRVDAYIALYQGDATRADEGLRATRADAKRPMTLELEGPRLDYAGITARVALAPAGRYVQDGGAADLREVDECLRVFDGARAGRMGFVGFKVLLARRALVFRARQKASNTSKRRGSQYNPHVG